MFSQPHFHFGMTADVKPLQIQAPTLKNLIIAVLVETCQAARVAKGFFTVKRKWNFGVVGFNVAKFFP